MKLKRLRQQKLKTYAYTLCALVVGLGFAAVPLLAGANGVINGTTDEGVSYSVVPVSIRHADPNMDPNGPDYIEVFISTKHADTKAFNVTLTYQYQGQTLATTATATRVAYVSDPYLSSLVIVDVPDATLVAVKSIVIEELVPRPVEH